MQNTNKSISALTTVRSIKFIRLLSIAVGYPEKKQNFKEEQNFTKKNIPKKKHFERKTFREKNIQKEKHFERKTFQKKKIPKQKIFQKLKKNRKTKNIEK